MGIEIDLVDQDRFTSNCNSQLDPADEKIFEEEIFMPQDVTRSKHHAKSVSWLRRTEYISTEQTRFQSQTVEKVEARVGYNVKKTLAVCLFVFILLCLFFIFYFIYYNMFFFY